MVALGNGEFGNTLVGERLLIVADTNMLGINHGLFQKILSETGTQRDIDQRECQYTDRNIGIVAVKTGLGIGQ